MTGKQHMTLGASLVLVSLNPLIVGSAIIGSITPDIDAHFSTISKYVPIQRMTHGFLMKHRGGVHSLFASFFVSVMYFIVMTKIDVVHVLMGGNIYLNSAILALGFLIGYVSHILSDMLTYRGVALYYPWVKKRIKFPIKGLNKSMCDGVVGIFIMLAVLLIYCRLKWL